jgi:hypothetical protein
MRVPPLMIVTAIVETGTGLLLLLWPALVFVLHLGWRQARTPAQLGVLAGLLTYNVLATPLLAFAGAALKMAGVLLWPAVVYHAVLAAWCVACLPRRRAAKRL